MFTCKSITRHIMNFPDTSGDSLQRVGVFFKQGIFLKVAIGICIDKAMFKL